MKVNRNKLELAMAKACTSVDDLSSEAKIGRTTLTYLCERDATPRTVGKIAKALGVDVKDILED